MQYKFFRHGDVGACVQVFDRDLDGLISAKELGMALRTLGLHVTEGKITQIMSTMSKHSILSNNGSDSSKVQRMVDLPNFLKVVVSIRTQSTQPVKCVVQCFDDYDNGTAFMADKTLPDTSLGQPPIVPNGTELDVVRMEDDGKLCFVRWLDSDGYVETRHLVPLDDEGNAKDASTLPALLEKNRVAAEQATGTKWFPRINDVEKALKSFFDPTLVHLLSFRQKMHILCVLACGVVAHLFGKFYNLCVHDRSEKIHAWTNNSSYIHILAFLPALHMPCRVQ